MFGIEEVGLIMFLGLITQLAMEITAEFVAQAVVESEVFQQNSDEPLSEAAIQALSGADTCVSSNSAELVDRMFSTMQFESLTTAQECFSIAVEQCGTFCQLVTNLTGA